MQEKLLESGTRVVLKSPQCTNNGLTWFDAGDEGIYVNTVYRFLFNIDMGGIFITVPYDEIEEVSSN
jgi:hypothetical protein